MAKTLDSVGGRPDLSHAAKNGAPTMTDPKRTYPASIPMVNNDAAAGATGTGTTDVSVSNASSGALDTKPDARTTEGAKPAATPPPTGPLPTNRDAELKKYRDEQMKKQAKAAKKHKKKAEEKETPAATPAPATDSSTPAKPPQ
jgi:hypothetical protein